MKSIPIGTQILTKTFIATDMEAKRLAKGDKVTSVHILNPQPPEGLKFDYIEKGHVVFKRDNYLWETMLRYPSGEYRVKETWDYGLYHLAAKGIYVQEYLYKADNVPALTYWRSPVTMPVEAIRWYNVEINTTVKRVQELSPNQKVLLGIKQHWCHEFSMPNCSAIEQDFIDYWNKLHAKPVPFEDGYVCYPYDMDSDTLEKCKYIEWSFNHTEPLKIFPNPILELNKVEVTNGTN